jgi:transposase-like protein
VTSPLSGEVEVDESSLVPVEFEVRDRGKTIIFGLLNREGKVYTEIVPDVIKATLKAIIRGKVDIDSIIHSDGCQGYHGLVDVWNDKHFRVHHGNNQFVRGNSQINGIESFWSYTKIRLVKFHGIDTRTFNLHLKECEFRFNNRGEDLYK